MAPMLPRPFAPLLIALDADGVLLDYNRQFGAVWARHFGTAPVCAEPRAYHAVNYWGVQTPAKDDPFWETFDREGWASMQPMPGAVDACHRLVAAGHSLVCVTSMPPHRQADRLANLLALEFPISQVIATGRCADRNANPKREAIEALQPDWFVDDELRKLKDLPGVSCALVDPDHPDSPNHGQDGAFLAWRGPSLSAFVDRLLAA